MSKISITPNASGTGVFTISSPATSTNRTLVLPDEAGTIITTAGVPSSAMPAGSVLQIINATYSTETSNSSSTYADTNLTATITPTNASSKILVFVCQVGLAKSNNEGVRLRLLRGATIIVQMETAAAFTNTTTTNRVGGSSATYLDSPATTSAVTYKTMFASSDNAASAQVQSGNNASTITLMEIAG
jgi:hypothetical protein